MKIRKGFVSNSSSSSFLVAFKRVPKNEVEMQKLIFGEQKGYGTPFPDSYSNEEDIPNWSAFDISFIVFEDMKKQKKPLSKEDMIEAMSSGHIDGYDSLYDICKFEDGGTDWNKLGEEVKKLAKFEVDRFLKRNKSMKIYIFSYSDDTELGCAMEHGDLFYKLPHIRISNH